MRSPAAERPASLWGQQTWRSAGGGAHRPSGHPSRDAARSCSHSGPSSLRFIEEKSSFEYGQVNHALAAAMRTLLKEYLILVTQLEQLQRQGLLSLQKLWVYIQPAMRTVDILASLGVRAWWEGLPGSRWLSSSFFKQSEITYCVLRICERKTLGVSRNPSFIV